MDLVRYHFFPAEDWPKIVEEANKLSDVKFVVRPERSSTENSKNIDCNEVYPGVFIGDGETAKNKKYLKQIKVTHVVNAAMGTNICSINTNAEYYGKTGIKFYGFNLEDNPSSHIAVHFEGVANFMDDALNSGGKVYVHCVCGISRSATLVIAFLMIKRFMTAESALRQLRSKRLISPNIGFLAQLAALEIKLRQEHDDYPRSVDAIHHTGTDQVQGKKCNVL